MISRFLLFFAAFGLALPVTQAFAGSPRNGQVLIGSASRPKPLPTPRDTLEPLLVVIDTPYEIFDDAGTFVHVAAWYPDGKPARKAKVYLAGQLVGKTDKHGSLVFRWGVPGADVEDYWVSGSKISVRAKRGDKKHGGDVWFSALSRTESFASDHLYVYTDRAVYEPGQTIQLRSIGWHLDVDYTPLEAKAVEYILTDPSGSTMTAAEATTDAFGTASSELVVPASAEEGVYILSATFEGATAEQRLRVERFKPPIMKIDHTLGRFLTRDTRALSWELSLSYFAGGAVGDVTVRVDGKARGESRYQTTTTVSGPGPHAFTLDEDAVEKLTAGLGDGDLVEFTLSVEDAFGRVDELTREMRYASNPYVVVIESDRDAWSAGDPVELVVRMTDHDRVPVRDTAVTLKSSAGQTLEATSDDKGTARFTLEMGDEGFDVEVFLPGVDAPVASRYLDWQAPQPMRSHIADPIVTEDSKATISVTFPAGFRPVEEVVHVDVVDTSGSLVNTVLLPIRESQGVYTAKGSFTAPSWGSMLLTLFCLGEEKQAQTSGDAGSTHLGVLSEGQQMVVHPGRQLEITLDGVPDSMKPGEAFKGRVTVRDGRGEEVDASLGVALVDASVISLKDPLEITPMDIFYNPELRTISTTGSAILTWPVVSRNWGGHRQDIALPPFPWKGGGAIERVYGEEQDEDSRDFKDDQSAGPYGKGSGKKMAKKSAPKKIMLGSASASGGGGGAAMPDEIMEEDSGSAGPQGRREGRSSSKAAAPKAVVTIRTEFPDTALWSPGLRVKDGEGRFEGVMPERITRQQFTLVASDKRGGVGVLRTEVNVTQPFYVRSSLPASLVLGDTVRAGVTVQNLSSSAVEVEVAVESEGLEAKPTGEARVRVEAGGFAVVPFAVKARAVGRATYRVKATSSAFEDTAVEELWVGPAGAPEVTIYDATLTAQSPFSQRVDVSGSTYTTATLNVVFPALSAAFAGLDAARSEHLDQSSALSIAGDLISTALVYRHQRQAGAEPARLDEMKQALQSSVVWLEALQRDDGGWGHRFSGSSPYLTAYVLEALVELDGAGVEVPLPMVQRAQRYLTGSRQGETWDHSAIAFWEGNTATVKRALQAEIFHVLTRLPSAMLTDDARALRDGLAAGCRAYLDSETPDVMTYAHIVLGLMEMGKKEGVPAELTLSGEALTSAVTRLDSVRSADHWEPSWYNAYGGTIEATVAVLTVLKDAEPGRFEAVQRDALRYLLSTRDGWGGWHNARGTASAIRGLMMLGAGSSEAEGAEVQVSVDDVVVKTVAVDPSDPWLSSISLRALDLTPHLGPGERRVSVSYTGALAPEVRLTMKRWGAPAGSAGPIAVSASLPTTELEVGAALPLGLRLESSREARALVQLRVPMPGVLEVSESSLEALVAEGAITAFSMQGPMLELTTVVEPGAARAFTLPLKASHAGEARFTGITAALVAQPGRVSADSRSAAELDATITVSQH